MKVNLCDCVTGVVTLEPLCWPNMLSSCKLECVCWSNFSVESLETTIWQASGITVDQVVSFDIQTCCEDVPHGASRVIGFGYDLSQLLKQKVANRQIAFRTVRENLLVLGAALNRSWLRITRAVVKRFSSAHIESSCLHCPFLQYQVPCYCGKPTSGDSDSLARPLEVESRSLLFHCSDEPQQRPE